MSLAIVVQQLTSTLTRTLLSTAWTTVGLTHLATNEDVIVSNFNTTDNTFQLAAGTYRFELFVTATGLGNGTINYFVSRLYNVTAGASAAASPMDVSSTGAVDNSNTTTSLVQVGSFTLTAAATFKVEAKAAFTSSNTAQPKIGIVMANEPSTPVWLKIIKKQ